MALPPVNGWLIDFRTAREIFEQQNNARIAHCVAMCEIGTLHISHKEEAEFRAHPNLKGPFIRDQNRVYEPNLSVLNHCQTVAGNPNCSKRIPGNEAAIYITAIAAHEAYGVISNHRSILFATVQTMCATFGVPVFSSEEYFSEVL